ncbi:hypothetical protein E8E95_02185 [Pseudomonas sp. BN414]|nr:hypothetical protein [Pseudomonas sp. BN414]MDH4580812.1 hypothetical protein [Pseudomonas sp. BN415]
MSFKSQVVKECLQPGAAVASVALSHGINANVVRKWLSFYRHQPFTNMPAFVSLKVGAKCHPQATVTNDRPYGQETLIVKWPAFDPEGCTRFVRRLTPLPENERLSMAIRVAHT